MTGVTFGGFGGCQVQFGVWVVGAEGDWWGNNKEGQAFAVNGPGAPLILPGTGLVGSGLIWSTKERWYATARARLGYAVDKWLFYVTGGGAWVKIDSSEFCVNNPTVPIVAGVVDSCQGPLASAVLQSDNRTGWTIGGGVEYALPYNWSIRSEYLFIRIPSYTTFTPGVGNGLAVANTFLPTNLTVANINNHVWRAGLTYRFDFGRAVAAVTK
jgi:outer membrane immunogenic protein